MKGVFVTGTDTNVGKTHICAGLLKAAHKLAIPAAYWKPVQSGTDESDDTVKVEQLTCSPATSIIEPVYRFKAPVSPHLAAAIERTSIDFSHLTSAIPKTDSRFLIVEGAGGVFVPLSENSRIIDFMVTLNFPVLIVAPDRLGAINHTLLTIEAVKAAKLKIAGFVMNQSAKITGNAAAITQHSGVPCLAHVSTSELIPDLSRLLRELV